MSRDAKRAEAGRRDICNTSGATAAVGRPHSDRCRAPRWRQPRCSAGTRKGKECSSSSALRHRVRMVRALSEGKAVPAWDEVSRWQRLATAELSASMCSTHTAERTRERRASSGGGGEAAAWQARQVSTPACRMRTTAA